MKRYPWLEQSSLFKSQKDYISQNIEEEVNKEIERRIARIQRHKWTATGMRVGLFEDYLWININDLF